MSLCATSTELFCLNFTLHAWQRLSLHGPKSHDQDRDRDSRVPRPRLWPRLRGPRPRPRPRLVLRLPCDQLEQTEVVHTDILLPLTIWQAICIGKWVHMLTRPAVWLEAPKWLYTWPAVCIASFNSSTQPSHPPKNRVHMLSKIIDPCISRRYSKLTTCCIIVRILGGFYDAQLECSIVRRSLSLRLSSHFRQMWLQLTSYTAGRL